MPEQEFNREDVPTPEELLNDALEETEDPLIALSEYADTILLLRKRGLTWEKIEEFFQKHRIEATAKDIYYVARREINRRRAESFKFQDEEFDFFDDEDLELPSEPKKKT